MKVTSMNVSHAIVIVAASFLLCASPIRAQGTYPSKPVRMIVPFAPAGPADIIARLVAQKLSEEFGKQFYVETHAGAGGNIGAGVAARAPADGYSLMITSQVTVINPHLYASLPYTRRTSSPSRASRRRPTCWW